MCCVIEISIVHRLKHNRFGDEGLQSLAAALPAAKSITKLE